MNKLLIPSSLIKQSAMTRKQRLLFGILSYIIWHQIVGELFTWGVAKDMKHPHYMKP